MRDLDEFEQLNKKLSLDANHAFDEAAIVLNEITTRKVERPQTAPHRPQTPPKPRVEVEPSEKVAVPPEIGQEATIRFLKAKVHVLQKELDSLVKNKETRNISISQLQEKLSHAQLEASKSQKMAENTRIILEKTQKQMEQRDLQIAELEADLKNTRTENEGAIKKCKLAETELAAKNLKLDKMLLQIEKQKLVITNEGSSYKSELDASRQTAQSLFAETKSLSNQNKELQMAIKKQQQLIEILKKQKLHMASIKYLEFSQQEFLKILERQ